MSVCGDSGTEIRSVLPFEAVPTALRGLRRNVRSQLAAWGMPAFADEAELVVSELASNVIKHVGEGVSATLVLEPTADRLRIELHDKSYQVPALSPMCCDEECGRGLHLLAGVAVAWGTVLTSTGKAVWCELWADPEGQCRRVRRAELALTQYRREVGAADLVQNRSARMLQESATDLIADLLHWVAAHGGDPDDLLDRAQMHYEAEAEVLAETA
ncbi:ATP-binding protein [Streptomyces sp. NBC_01669]|uniref:ATP-binding protein n=1 Tax=Streptomyces sp. NBC_01669 TaxID=2975909 RepID=UPI0022542407|nr:ATP-binding protein [Streptomyces sp. NBC_01669]MCX4534873.1 ATP-binding protein [Streptomyces sp. NBC_01669]